MDPNKEALIKSKKVSTEDLIRSDLENNPNSEKISKPGILQRKMKRMRKAFSDFWVVGKTGFMMGSLVGSIMGFLYGSVAAYQSKTLAVIPISMISSGFFFGCLMTVGAVLRSDGLEENVLFIVPYERMEYDNKLNMIKFTKSNSRL